MADAYAIFRPLLFMLEAERAHNMGLSLMRVLPDRRVDDRSLHVRTALGDLANPIGMPAGYDKTGRHLETLARLGFGYVVAGTFTLKPWPGNPKPRVVRNVKEKTLVNALGFPNPGIDAFIARLASQHPKVPVVASISGKTISDVLESYSKVQPHVVGVELNLSSPNTPELRDLRDPPAFAELTEAMLDRHEKPTYLKIPPYLDDASFFAGPLTLVKRWAGSGFEGVTASNSITVEDRRVAVGRGGYSGPPLLEHTRTAVREIRKVVPKSFEIHAVGGISSPADVVSLIENGATTVQIFTALVYQGPSLITRILKDEALKEALRSKGSSAARG